MIDKTPPSDLCMSVLKVISANEPVTRAELEEIMPGVGIVSAIDTLIRRYEFIQGVRGDRTSLYSTTPKGKRAANPQKLSGVIAAPRAPVSADHYTAPRQMAYRPGAMDAYSKPSRTGDTFTPYTRPLILASKVQSTRFP